MSNDFKDYRVESRKNWGRYQPHQDLNADQLQIGALLRIADATEAMSKNHTDLQARYDMMKSSRDSWRRNAEAAQRKVAALKGVITKLNKKLKQ